MIQYPALVVVKCFAGMEELLAEEINSICQKECKILKRAVEFSASKEDIYRVNYLSRFGIKVLVEFTRFPCGDEQSLYDQVKAIEWEKFLSLQDTFSINAVLINSKLDHTKYAALKCKDAIADRFRDKYGERPNVNTIDPDLKIHLHVSNNQAILSFDSSGEPLFKRGYRQETGPAPLNEIVAAAIIKWTGWNGEVPLIDITCGSGTLLTEAARMALNRPSQEKRKKFGFFSWRDFDPKLFTQIRQEADQSIANTEIKLIGVDISQRVLEAAKENASSANVDHCIRFIFKDFNEFEPKEEAGVIVANPPYGERLTSENIRRFYNDLGSWLKHNAVNFSAYILSMDHDESKQIGLKPKWQKQVFNGSIPCKLRAYELYSGSKKKMDQTIEGGS
ncbi:MAG TPA: THUMP domain-containing protein [Bacteroidia bacterium]|nr:THUMP domain-containing protein [Bacteroidia bacterium]